MILKPMQLPFVLGSLRWVILSEGGGNWMRPFEENLGEEPNAQEQGFFVQIKGARMQWGDFLPG
jgi:hypothetical protein